MEYLCFTTFTLIFGRIKWKKQPKRMNIGDKNSQFTGICVESFYKVSQVVHKAGKWKKNCRQDLIFK